ncbi:MAG: hypothetical protein WC803_12335 [Sphingomonas sp.]|jgi:hypothetical protein
MVKSNVVQLPRRCDSAVAPKTVPPWLVSGDYDAPQWTVADGSSYRIYADGEARTAVIDFDQTLPDGSRLLHPSNVEWLSLAKQYVVLLREHETSRIQTAWMQAAQAREMFKLMSFMRLGDDPIPSFSQLRRIDIDRYALAARYGVASILDVAGRAARLAQSGIDISDPIQVRKRLHLPFNLDIADDLAVAAGRANGAERKALTHNPLFRSLLVLEQLWTFRREIEGDNIGIDPFETSASAEAAKHCSDTNRTPTIPQRQAMTLIDGCIRLFVDLSARVAEIRRDVAAAVDGASSVEAKRKASEAVLAAKADNIAAMRARLRMPEEAAALRVVENATVLLVQACFVLIAALSARRDDEIATLREDCVLGGDGSRFVFSAILKTEGENQHTPVPDIVSRLVDWLVDLGADARARSGSTRLFCWTDATTLVAGPRVRSTVPRDLDALAALCDVPPHEGAPWRFTARQFRRFFAILYMWRHENPDLGALRLHLRHWDFRQTRAYCTDTTLGRIFTEEQRGFTRTVVTEAMAGVRAVGGAAGARLMAMVARKKRRFAGVVAMEPERLADWSARIADRMVIRCNPWSYCTCPDTRRGAKDANCRTGGDQGAVGPDLSRATPETCIGCRHRMTDGIFAPFMRTEISLGERMLASPAIAGTVIALATAKRLEVIRPHVASADALGTPV